MKHWKDKTVPATTQQVLESTTCDLCGEIIPTRCLPDATDVEVVATRVFHDRDGGGNGTKLQYDICMVCFISTLVPFMESKGANRDWQEWDY